MKVLKKATLKGNIKAVDKHRYNEVYDEKRDVIESLLKTYLDAIRKELYESFKQTNIRFISLYTILSKNVNTLISNIF